MSSVPKFTPMNSWLGLSGMTRTGTYQAIKDGFLRAIKQPGGRRTLIDVEQGLSWLSSQPSIDLNVTNQSNSK